jgi:hypothetical protein
VTDVTQGRYFADGRGSALRLCTRAWWAFFVGGLASVVFGIVAIVNPTIALFVLASFFAASMLVDGVVNAAAGIRHRNKDGWWLLLMLGIAGIVVGGYALMNPALTMAAFVFAAAFMAIVAGAALITLGYGIRKDSEREWLLYATGGLSLLFGALIFFDPREYGPSLMVLIAVGALGIGAMRIWFAFRIRGLAERTAAAGLRA